jgi:hypothetical protein
MVIKVSAQDEPEYKLELGANAGLVAYEGDFNGNLMKGLRPMGGVVAKYKPNPRMAWAASLSLGQLKGSSDNDKTYYPASATQPIEFTSTLTDFSLRYEYNFWAFGTGREYFGAKRLTPFIAIGLGLAYANSKLTQNGETTKKGTLVGQLPIGIGLKYKLATRLNLAAEWMMHFTGGDKLDGVGDPYGIESSGLFKNTDCYSTLYITLTYDLWAKCRTCHKE